MSIEPEQPVQPEPLPAYQNYPAMPAAQPGPYVYRKSGVNGFAIASFVTGIVGIIGGAVFSVIFGIIALVGIRRTRQRGKGFAIAGLVLSGVWTAVLVVIVVSGVLQAIREAPARGAASYNFKVGQCFDRQATNKAAASTPVDCATPHYAEVYAVETLPGTIYPGTSAVQAIGHTKCPDDSAKWLTPGLNYPDVTTAFLFPQADSWLHGDRTIKCFYRRVDGAKMTGHVKDFGVPYTAEQKRYLDAVAPYNKIVDEELDAISWTDERDIAVRSVPIVQQEIAALRAGPWPAAVQPAIDKLVAVKQLELADRQRAAAATDEGSLNDALDDADSDDGTDEARAVRTALHLPAG